MKTTSLLLMSMELWCLRDAGYMRNANLMKKKKLRDDQQLLILTFFAGGYAVRILNGIIPDAAAAKLSVL